MATSAGEVEVKLSLNADDFKSALTGGQNQLNAFGGVLQGFATKMAAVFSFAAIADFFKQSLNAYAENQLAVTRLVAALNNQGTATQVVVDKLTGLSQALQDETGTSKNAILAAETLLTTFHVTADVMPKVIQATLDLSAATGVDLQRAALLMGKAYEGQTGTLSRYGVLVSSHIPLNERFAAVLGQVEQRFGGAAQAQAETYTGRLNIMKLAFNDLQESVGSFLAGPAGGLVTWLTNSIRAETNALDIITKATTELNGFGNVLKVMGIELLRVVIDSMTQLLMTMVKMLSYFPLMGTAVSHLTLDIVAMNKSLNSQIDAWDKTTLDAIGDEGKKQEAVLQTKTIVIEAIDLQSKEIADKMAEEVKLRTQHAEETKKAYIALGESFHTTTADMWNFATKMSGEFFQGFGDGFAKMIMEGKNFSDSMKALFKNMAEEMISYIVQMIVKMLVLLALETAVGMPVGGAGAGIGGFLGAFATGGVIDEPSIIVGLRSGKKTLAGEAGPETVSPMSGGNQGAGSSDTGSARAGGNITINITGQFVEGDQNSWNRLMREKIIPQIRRFTMSSPTGPFNRTRGVV